MNEEERQDLFALPLGLSGLDVHEMNLDPVQIGLEVFEGIQPLLSSPPVILFQPVLADFFQVVSVEPEVEPDAL